MDGNYQIGTFSNIIVFKFNVILVSEFCAKKKNERFNQFHSTTIKK